METLHKCVRACCVSLGATTVAFTMVAVVAVWDGYRFNATTSAPVGVWKISEQRPGNVSVGQYVLICPPQHEVLNSLIRQGRMFKGKCESGTVPFIKEVVAKGEGSFRVETEGVYIDDKLIDSTEPYPWENLIPAQASVIRPDEFVAIQTMHPGSIDSRYFGPMRVSDVIGVIEPKWIF